MEFDEILTFWLGNPPTLQGERWYKKDPAFDQEIRERFSDVHDQSLDGKLNQWLTDPRGRVAWIILLDQFSRNMFRGEARAFAQDQRACEVSKEGIQLKMNQEIGPIERSFFYMPLMHSEAIEDQENCVQLFEKLIAEVESEASLKEFAAESLHYAKLHREIIQRFGRFPHRNEILGRETSAEELEFLKGPNSSF